MTGFHMQTEDRSMKQVNDQPSGNLPFLKPDDIQYFDKLLVSPMYTRNARDVENLGLSGCVLKINLVFY